MYELSVVPARPASSSFPLLPSHLMDAHANKKAAEFCWTAAETTSRSPLVAASYQRSPCHDRSDDSKDDGGHVEEEEGGGEMGGEGAGGGGGGGEESSGSDKGGTRGREVLDRERQEGQGFSHLNSSLAYSNAYPQDFTADMTTSLPLRHDKHALPLLTCRFSARRSRTGGRGRSWRRQLAPRPLSITSQRAQALEPHLSPCSLLLAYCSASPFLFTALSMNMLQTAGQD